MRFCEYKNCDQPVFGSDKNTRIGYCRRHQFARTDLSKLSITAKAIQKHKEQNKRKPTKAGWFDVQEVFKENAPTSGVTSFEPPKWMVDEANDVVKEFKLGERGKSELWDWFLDRREEMVGVCCNCSRESLKKSDKLFQNSIAHVLPKSVVKSVATNIYNWLELCQQCHDNMDNHVVDLIDMNCFAQIIDKVVKMYPDIAKEERRRIPPILLEYIKTEL